MLLDENQVENDNSFKLVKEKLDSFNVQYKLFDVSVF